MRYTCTKGFADFTTGVAYEGTVDTDGDILVMDDSQQEHYLTSDGGEILGCDCSTFEVLQEGKLMGGINLKCIAGSSVFVKGNIYPAEIMSAHCYRVKGDGGSQRFAIDKNTLEVYGAPEYGTFEIVSDGTEDYTSTPDEDEAFQKLEQDLKDAPLVGMALHIREIQKWMKESGCDEEMELKIGREYVNISPFPELTYESQEGGVGTLIDYMKHSGAALKCVAKMVDVG